MLKYKDTFAAKGSDLYNALQTNQANPENAKLVKKLHSETYERYKKMYSEEDRKWFQGGVVHEQQ